MLTRSSRSLYISLHTLSSRLSSSYAKTNFPSSKLTQSYYHHASDIPLSYDTVAQHLDKLAEAYPTHECYAFKAEGNKRYTYKSFLDEVDSLASSLIELGFQKGDRIGVWLPNTSENCAMTYAASKAGVIKVNINPAYKHHELAYSINKVGCKGLVMRPNVKTIDCMQILSKIAPDLGNTKVELDAKSVPTLKHVILTPGDNETASRVPRGMHLYSDLVRKGAGSRQEELRARQSELDGDDPLEIFYTSGTTGQPKGVTLTNSNLLNNRVHLYYSHPTLLTRVCSPAPSFHIFGEVSGAMHILTPGYFVAFPAILPDTLATMRAIQEEKCTALLAPLIVLRDILHHPQRKEYDLSSVLFGITGASPIDPVFIEEFQREIPMKTLSQVYGQTENTGLMTLNTYVAEGDGRRFTSVGKTTPRTEIKIANAKGRVLPIGEEGEICARGFHIMQGYYGDEEKTRETITPSGWLRTGDLGTMDEDGCIYYRSRQKELVIIGGINVYPVEIENVLLEHPSIGEAQVFGIPDERYGEVLCAWVNVKPNTKLENVEEVRQFLEEKVAFFKVPKYMKVIESFLPFTTATGKVQKFKLTEAMTEELAKNICII